MDLELATRYRIKLKLNLHQENTLFKENIDKSNNNNNHYYDPVFEIK